MKAQIHITLKQGVLDPQGNAIAHALHHLGFKQVHQVRQGKYIELDFDCEERAEAEKQVTDMCEQLLANMVIENYRFDLV